MIEFSFGEIAIGYVIFSIVAIWLTMRWTRQR